MDRINLTKWQRHCGQKTRFGRAPASVLGKTIGQADQTTLQEMSVISNTEVNEQLAKNYETVGTQVRRDLGDSMTKAFQNVDAILDDLGLDRTSANQRAVRILAYNQMEITKESVLSMKDYDAKVTSVLEQMKPAAVAKMIEKQENPLEMTMDEIEAAIQKIQEEQPDDDMTLRKYLWKLDHKGDITPEERKSMIGIYRLIDKVEKSDGAVIGQLVKEGRELTFSSLLSAVRTRRAEGKEFTIDDDFGSLESQQSRGETISEQIGAAFGNQVVRRLKKELSPEALRQTGEDVTCEQILEACETPESQAEDAAYYEALAQNYLRDGSIERRQYTSVSGGGRDSCYTAEHPRDEAVSGKRNAQKTMPCLPGKKVKLSLRCLISRKNWKGC